MFLITVSAIVVYLLASWYLNVIPDDNSLVTDLQRIRDVYDIDAILRDKALLSTEHVRSYYDATTERDYALLELFMGSGMHTRLQGVQQAAFIMHEIAEIQAERVLEVGCGKGHCSLWLARAMQDVHFSGMDLLPRHVETAIAASCDLENTSFFQGDALHLSDERFDIIFGVESLCHIDTPEKLWYFIQQATAKLNAGGRLVIIDGFRSPTFDIASPEQQLAMLLAESGFKIRSMPSKMDWIELCTEAGLTLVMDLDLTAQAMPFWSLGWRISRLIVGIPYFVRWLITYRPQTASNLLSVSMTAHAMRDSGAAEYGMLVFTN